MDDNKKLLPVNPDDDEKKEKKPRKRKGLSKNSVSAIYMGIALCMVAMLTVSMISTTNKVQQTVDDFSVSDISLPDISLNVPDISDSNNVMQEDKKPVGNDVSGVTDEITMPESDESDDTTQPQVATYKRPVDGEVLKGYYADALVFSETMQDFRTHGGVDIKAELGASVLAYTDGIISKIEKDPFMGTTVEITHNAGLVSVYKNLAETLPDGTVLGAEVTAGDVIGTVGQSAILEIADPAHLHFELWMEGDCINAEKEISTLK